MDNSLLLPVAIGAASFGLLLWSVQLRKRHRLLCDLPTSKAGGVFIGFVELKGTAEAEEPIRGFLTEKPCVHYRYRVEESWSRVVIETYTDADGKTRRRTRTERGWSMIAAGGDMIPFYLRDETGAVLIRPQDATIEPKTLFRKTVGRSDPLYYAKAPAHAVAHSNHVRRFVEQGIPLHAPLYVVGQARERSDVVAPEIAASKDAECFLISTNDEERVTNGYSGASWLTWMLALAAAGTTGYFARNPAKPDSSQPIVVAVSIFFAVWIGLWIWMIYNSLVSLRERVRQAWSLIDVQLKRRHDLIPNLVAVLSTDRTHEQSVQTALAGLRGQAQATPINGEGGRELHGIAGSLRVVIENYPKLKANEGFTRLHRELVNTEQRIALARTYYNDIATHFATRLERVPDRFVARLGAMRPLPLLAADDFERAEVRPNFSTET